MARHRLALAVQNLRLPQQANGLAGMYRFLAIAGPLRS